MNHTIADYNYFGFAFYNKVKKAYVTAAEFLALYRRGDTSWMPDIEFTGLSLVVAREEWTLRRRSVGRYPDLIPQLEAISSRLSQDRVALLRTAVDDSNEGTYFLFEPRLDKVLISLFYIQDKQFFAVYPIPDAHSEKLYDYVHTYRSLLLSSEEDSAMYQFNELPFPTDELIQNIDREIEVGKNILSLPYYITQGY